MTSTTPVCVKDAVMMKPEKNGVYFLEYASFGPYKLWISDKWKCPECGLEILSGFGNNPLAEHWQDGFIPQLKRLRESKSELIEENRLF